MTTAAPSTTAEPTVLFAHEGPIAILTLNRPASLNSFTRQMHRDLWAALDRVQANRAIRALVLTGAGRAFCAGADLSEFDFRDGADLMHRADPGPVIEQAFNPTTRRLVNLGVPTVCAVNGVAAGAGFNLALSCDIIFAARSARFIQIFVRRGLIPDLGGTYFLPRLVGLAKAKELMAEAGYGPDKPLALTLEQADEMIAAAKSRGVPSGGGDSFADAGGDALAGAFAAVAALAAFASDSTPSRPPLKLMPPFQICSTCSGSAR